MHMQRKKFDINPEFILKISEFTVTKGATLADVNAC
jgi:hypothetical protein